jgi:hypothetical protein
MIDNQNPVPLSEKDFSQQAPLPPKTGWWTKKRIIIAIVGLLVLGSFSRYLSHLIKEVEQKDSEAKVSQTENSNLIKQAGMTREKIQQLKPTINEPFGDYFQGKPEEQKQIVLDFVTDNSLSDPTYLYIAANTAYYLKDYKNAFILFYEAQLRRRFDYKRFDLGRSDGNNVQTYWNFLNQTVGENINPKMLEEYQDFIAAIKAVKNWQVVPSDNAIYPNMPNEPVLAKEDWLKAGQDAKQDFMDNFGDKMTQLVADADSREKLLFIQNYNYRKIEKTPENEKKFEEYSKIFDELVK